MTRFYTVKSVVSHIVCHVKAFRHCTNMYIGIARTVSLLSPHHNTMDSNSKATGEETSNSTNTNQTNGENSEAEQKTTLISGSEELDKEKSQDLGINEYSKSSAGGSEGGRESG
jgi:hypothetical protein